MYRLEEGYLLASLLKMKIKYFREYFVTNSELRRFEQELYQKEKELDISLVCVSQDDLDDYFTYQGSHGCYVMKEGIGLADILRRFEGYLPVEVLQLLYTDEFMLEMFIKVEEQELKVDEGTLEKKSLLLQQLELNSLKSKEKTR